MVLELFVRLNFLISVLIIFLFLLLFTMRGLIGRASACYAGGRGSIPGRQPLSVEWYQLLPCQALDITGIKLGKSTCSTTSGLTPCCGIYCVCSCMAEGRRNGDRPALMHHLAREEIYFYYAWFAVGACINFILNSNPWLLMHEPLILLCHTTKLV